MESEWVHRAIDTRKLVRVSIKENPEGCIEQVRTDIYPLFETRAEVKPSVY
jgi:hypothetical protein